MNKATLIETLSDRLGGKRTATEAVDAVVETITRAVASGEKVAITGFGVFEKVARPARTGRNPRTGASVKIKKTTVPKFKAGQHFKDVVSGAKKLGKAASASAGSAATAARGAAKSTGTKSTTAKKSTGTKAAAKSTTTRSPAKKSSTTKSSAAKSSAAKSPTKKSTAKAASKAPARKASTARKTSSASGAKKTAGKRTAKKS